FFTLTYAPPLNDSLPIFPGRPQMLQMPSQYPRPVAVARINVETEPGDNFGEKLRSCIRRLVPEGGTCRRMQLRNFLPKVSPRSRSEERPHELQSMTKFLS